MSCYLKKLFSLKGQVAAVTGKSNQFSKAIANNLSKSGAKVYHLDSYPILAAKLNTRSGKIPPEICNDYNFGSLYQELSKKHFRLNTLVNHLEIKIPNKVIQDELAQQEYFYRIFKNNLGNAISNSKLATKLMKKSGFCSIINVICFIRSGKCCDSSGYVSIQHSLNILTKKWASDLIKDNIRVNNLILVNVKDEIGKERTSSECKQDEEDSLMGTIIFLASQNSLHMTGQNIFHFYRR